jgi:flavodoxin
VAKAIGQAIAGEVKLKKVGESRDEDLEGIDLLIIGSPTHGGRASQNIQYFLNRLSNESLKNISVAAFDTGVSTKDQGFFVKTIIKFFGYAAKHIAGAMEKKGGRLVAEPVDFFVKGKEGPLLTEELERAKKWVKSIKTK